MLVRFKIPGRKCNWNSWKTRNFPSYDQFLKWLATNRGLSYQIVQA